jgi:hypothetical protein
MTGMASYGAVHKDDEIWALVAFVQRLPKMTPEQYNQMEQAPAGSGRLRPLSVGPLVCAREQRRWPSVARGRFRRTSPPSSVTLSRYIVSHSG